MPACAQSASIYALNKNDLVALLRSYQVEDLGAKTYQNCRSALSWAGGIQIHGNVPRNHLHFQVSPKLNLFINVPNSMSLLLIFCNVGLQCDFFSFLSSRQFPTPIRTLVLAVTLAGITPVSFNILGYRY